ncbi:hypothetical protein Tco_1199807 [Tanacetum coccineum]
MGYKKKTNDESGTPRSQSGWKTSWAKKDDKEDQCASQVVDSSNTNQWGKKEAGSSPFSSGKLWKTNDESGTPSSQSGWKTSWAKKDDKEDQCASRVVDSSNTNQWGKKEAGSSPSSSGKWAAVKINMCAVDVARSSLDFSNTNLWGKKEAGSSPPSFDKWAAVDNQ